jgi:hypothetical protein
MTSAMPNANQPQNAPGCPESAARDEYDAAHATRGETPLAAVTDAHKAFLRSPEARRRAVRRLQVAAMLLEVGE